jgi:hypothetical protein
MKSSNVVLATDRGLQAEARRQGLHASIDRHGLYYLQILDPPESEDLNPHLVLNGVTRHALETYLRARHSKHRELTPNEVLGPILADQAEEPEGETYT